MDFWHEKSEDPALAHQDLFVEDRRSSYGEGHEADIDDVMLYDPKRVKEQSKGEII